MTTPADQMAIYATQSQAGSFFVDKMGLLSVNSFKAKGDGITDDTQAIRNCIANATLRGLTSIFFPHGVYKVNGLLGNELSGFFLWGDNSSFLGIETPINQIGTNITEYNDRFLGLIETPKSFDSYSGQVLAVKTDESGLEFVDLQVTYYTKNQINTALAQRDTNLNNHINNEQAHPSNKITYDDSGNTKVKGDTVEKALDSAETEIKNIILGNANAEVGDAHVSTAKGKTFPDIRSRLEESEAQLIDMANNKVDKNGAGQVTLEMLTQSAREELSGGTVGVVSPQSVSMQILTTDMQNDISSWIQQTLSLITGTHYRITGGYAVENTSSALYHSVILPISSGDRIKLTTQMSSTNAYGYIFVKDDMQVLSSGLQGIGSILAYTDYEVTAPALATKVIICVYNSTTLMTLKKLIYQSIASKEYINGLFKVSNELIFADWEVGGIGTSGANNTLTTRIRTALYHQFSEGNAVITITPQAGYKFCVFIYDASKTFISYAWYTVPFTLVVNKNYFYRFSIADTGDGTAYLAYVDHVSFINDYSLSYLDLNANINLKKRKGKYLSVLGDSISAYSGYIPAGNTAYYTGANSGVTLVSDMWWYKVCEKLGMRPLVINAWSGSKVSSIDAATTPFTPMSDVARCQALHNGSILPDEILIFAGTNDYSKPNANIGTWTGATALPSDNNTFSNAYALMLSRIQTSYPNAKIYCCSLPIFVRTNTEKTSVEFNSEGKTIFEYNEVIRRAANLFGCSYIDLQGCGITRQNAYPTYCEDYSNTPTHPNALGHTVYADHIVKKMS